MNFATELTERTRDLILDQIKANIVAQLGVIRTSRNDPSVNVAPPRSYFIYDAEQTLTFQSPAIFLVVDSGELPEQQTGANHINAVMKLYCSAVIEGTEAGALTILCERYQSALCRILHQLTVDDPGENVKIYVRVVKFQFSPIYTKSRKQGENMANFKKEVALELEVKHFECPTV